MNGSVPDTSIPLSASASRGGSFEPPETQYGPVTPTLANIDRSTASSGNLFFLLDYARAERGGGNRTKQTIPARVCLITASFGLEQENAINSEMEALVK